MFLCLCSDFQDAIHCQVSIQLCKLFKFHFLLLAIWKIDNTAGRTSLMQLNHKGGLESVICHQVQCLSKSAFRQKKKLKSFVKFTSDSWFGHN